MKSQFKKGKYDKVWYLTISGDTDILRKFTNIWKSVRDKIEENKLCSMIKLHENKI